MERKMFHVRVIGLDDDVVVWEGVTPHIEFSVNDGVSEFQMIAPEPTPIAEQVRTKKAAVGGNVSASTVYYVQSWEYSEVEVTPVEHDVT